jgi:hypothetical protein
VPEHVEKAATIAVVAEDRLLSVAAYEEVVDRSWVTDPVRAGDPATLVVGHAPDHCPD